MKRLHFLSAILVGFFLLGTQGCSYHGGDKASWGTWTSSRSAEEPEEMKPQAGGPITIEWCQWITTGSDWSGYATNCVPNEDVGTVCTQEDRGNCGYYPRKDYTGGTGCSEEDIFRVDQSITKPEIATVCL